MSRDYPIGDKGSVERQRPTVQSTHIANVRRAESTVTYAVVADIRNATLSSLLDSRLYRLIAIYTFMTV